MFKPRGQGCCQEGLLPAGLTFPWHLSPVQGVGEPARPAELLLQGREEGAPSWSCSHRLHQWSLTPGDASVLPPVPPPLTPLLQERPPSPCAPGGRLGPTPGVGFLARSTAVAPFPPRGCCLPGLGSDPVQPPPPYPWGWGSVLPVYLPQSLASQQADTQTPFCRGRRSPPCYCRKGPEATAQVQG